MVSQFPSLFLNLKTIEKSNFKHSFILGHLQVVLRFFSLLLYIDINRLVMLVQLCSAVQPRLHSTVEPLNSHISVFKDRSNVYYNWLSKHIIYWNWGKIFLERETHSKAPASSTEEITSLKLKIDRKKEKLESRCNNFSDFPWSSLSL